MAGVCHPATIDPNTLCKTRQYLKNPRESGEVEHPKRAEFLVLSDEDVVKVEVEGVA